MTPRRAAARQHIARIACALLLCNVTLACRPKPARTEPAVDLPPLPVYVLAPTTDTALITRAPAASATDLLSASALAATRRVSLTTSNADVRTLLLWLAREAGVSVVVSPEVVARVSVSFTDVPAGEAMQAVMREAGLSVLLSPTQPRWVPVVFHQVPVNINSASAEQIAARFGVSSELARWIVESRERP